MKPHNILQLLPMTILLVNLTAVLLLAGSCSADSAEDIANSLLDALEKDTSDKIFDILAVPDPENISEETDLLYDYEDNVSVGRINWGKLGSTFLKVTRKIAQATKTKILSFFRRLRKATKYVLNKVSEGTKKVWEKLKSKMPGNLAERGKKAGKKLVKSMLKQVYEEGGMMAIEYVQALVVDYIHTMTEEEFCQCPIMEKPAKCRCCIKPPGFAKSCMVFRARPKKNWFMFSFKYNGTEFMKAKIAEDERGTCDKGLDDVSRKVCKNLPHYLHFLHMCFTPGEIFPTEDGGFVGCFQLSVDSLKLGIEKCVIYQTNEEGIGYTTIINPAALGLEDQF